MLTIRAAQITAFRSAASRRDDERLLDAVRAAWPHTCAALGIERTRARVRSARERAMAAGIVSLAAIARFIHIDFALGEYFEGRYPLAAELLAHPTLGQNEKIDHLLRFAMSVLEAGRTRGPTAQLDTFTATGIEPADHVG